MNDSLNHIYKVIWSKAHMAWVAVSEATTAQGKQQSVTRSSRGVATVAAIMAGGAAIAAPPVWAAPATNALPTQGQVTAGVATINTSGSTLTVNQSSDRAAINWGSYNIGSGATVNYVQPGSSSVALNRDLSGQTSQIYGHLNANGQVYFINSAGVYFAPGAQVNVGGIVATTMDMSDKDFMSGSTTFKRNGSTGKVVNEGNITSLDGYIALLAPEVRNSGVLVAQSGTVALAAGEAVTLNFGANSKLSSITVDPAKIATLVENRLAVQAPNGLVILSARAANQLAASVVNSGVIDASGVSQQGGRLVLDGNSVTNTGTLTAASSKAAGGSIDIAANNVSLSGTVDASGATQGGTLKVAATDTATLTKASLKVASSQGTAGNVTLTGNQLILTDSTKINATGATGGGNVLIGGDWQGSNGVQQAVSVNIDKTVTVDASATDNGNGGKIVAWSDVKNNSSVTTVDGTLIAKGGVNGGNGGNIETSGHSLNTDTITVNANAAKGKGGLWLIDPYDYTISGTSASNIVSTLNSNTSVNVMTSSNSSSYGATGSGSGNITVNSDLIWSGTGSLTLTADNNIFLNSSIIASGLGAGFTAKANGYIQGASSKTFSTNGGNLTFWSNANGGNNGGIWFGDSNAFVTNGGNILMAGGTADANGNPTGAASSAGYIGIRIGSTSGGSTTNTMSSGGGNITLNGTTASGWQGLALTRGVNINAGNGTLSLTGSSTGGHGIEINAWSGANSNLTAGSIVINGTGGSNMQGVGVFNNTLTLTATGAGGVNITGQANSNANGIAFTGNVITNATQGNVTLRGTSAYGRGVYYVSGSVNAAGNISVIGNGASWTGVENYVAMTAGQNLSITGTNNNAGRGIYNTGTLTAGGNITLTGIGGNYNGIENYGNINANGSVALVGNATNGSATGIYSSGANITAGSDISLTGNASSAASGVYINSGNLAAKNGNISLISNANLADYGSLVSSGQGKNILVKSNGWIAGGSNQKYQTNNGNFTVWSNANGGTNGGIWFGDSNTFSTAGGNILMGGGNATDANGNPTGAAIGAGSNFGVQIGSASCGSTTTTINSGGGNITMNGASTSNTGLLLARGVNINAGAGTLSLTGTTTTGGGIEINGWSGTSSALTAGQILISGSALNNGGKTAGGVNVNNNLLTLTATGPGGVRITGQSNYDSNAIYFNANVGINAQQGDVTLTGTSTNGRGIYYAAGSVNAAGNISATGTGAALTGAYSGVENYVAMTAGKNIAITGTSTAGGRGIYNAAGGTLTAGGNITLVGTGGNYNGIENYAAINANGSLTMTGNASSGSGNGIYNGGSGLIKAGGDVTLTGTGIYSGQAINAGGNLSLISQGASFFGITLNSNLITTGLGKSLLVKADGGINGLSNMIFQTNNGNMTFWSNANDSTGSGTQFDQNVAFNTANGSTTQTTGGGNIRIGGGSAVDANGNPTGAAVSSSLSGIELGNGGTQGNSNVTFYSGGGNINISGSGIGSYASYDLGVAVREGVIMNAGNGDINITGTSKNYVGVEFGAYGGSSSVPMSLTGRNINITGTTTGYNANHAAGVAQWNSAMVINASGNVNITGKSKDWTALDIYNTSINAGGNVTLIGTVDSGYALVYGLTNSGRQNITAGGDITLAALNTGGGTTGDLLIGYTGGGGATITSTGGNISLVSNGQIGLNGDLITTAQGDSVLVKANGGISALSNMRYQTNNGSLVFWSNANGDAGNGIQFDQNVTFNTANGSTTQSTGGGKIIIGGGTAVDANGNPTGAAVSTALSGIELGNGGTQGNSNVTFYSGGGDISVNGSGIGTYNVYNMGVASREGVIMNAGNGNISITGSSKYYNGIEFGAYDGSASAGTLIGRNITINGTSTTAHAGVGQIHGTPMTINATGNVSITGRSDGNSQAVWMNNTAITANQVNITGYANSSTAGGVYFTGPGINAPNGVNITGISAGGGYGIYLTSNLLRASGDINLNAGGSNVYINAVVGQLAGSSVPTSTANITITGSSLVTGSNAVLNTATGNITINADHFNFANALTLGTTGNITIAPLDSRYGFGQDVNTSWFNINPTIAGTTYAPKSFTLGNTNNNLYAVNWDKAATVNGNVNLYGRTIQLSQNLNATGNTLLYGNTSQTSTGNISTAGLLLQNGNATLTNSANQIATLAANNVGSISVVDASGGLTIGTVNNVSGIQSIGTVNVSTLVGDIHVTEAIKTTDFTTKAVTLNSGSLAAVGTSTGGNITISNNGAVSVGKLGTLAGRATLYTSDVVDSTGVTDLVGYGSGHFRYNSNATVTNYNTTTAALGSGLYAIYRASPSLTVTASAGPITYGTTFTNNDVKIVTNAQNGDGISGGTFAATANITGNTSLPNGAGYWVAGNHTIVVTGNSTGANIAKSLTDLGYSGVSFVNGTLTVNKANLTVTTANASAVYNNTGVSLGSSATATGLAAGESVTNATLSSVGAVAGANVGNYAIAVSNATGAGGFNTSNYNITYVNGTLTVTPKDVTLVLGNLSGTVGSSKTYDGNTNYTANPADLASLSSGLINGDMVTAATGNYDNKNVGTGKAITLNASSVVISGGGASNYNIKVVAGSSSNNSITQAQSATWTGGAGDNNYFNPGNWKNGVIPDLANVKNVDLGGANVSFNNSAAVGVAERGNVSLTSLSNGNLTQAVGNLSVGSGGIALNNLTVNGGTLSNTGNTLLAGNYTQTAGTANLTGNLLNVTGTVNVSGGNLTNSGGNLSGQGNTVIGGDYIQSGGNVTLGNGLLTDSSTGTIASTANISGNYSQTGGTATTTQLNVNGTVNLSTGANLTNRGSLTIGTGLVMNDQATNVVVNNGSFTVSGAYTQNGGAITVNSGSVTINATTADATLGGNITVTGGRSRSLNLYAPTNFNITQNQSAHLNVSGRTVGLGVGPQGNPNGTYINLIDDHNTYTGGGGIDDAGGHRDLK